MEQFLHTVFSCCFPTRRSRRSTGEQHERTPLLGDGINSTNAPKPNSISEGAASPGSESKRVQRKHNSVLPTPAYDAHVLKTILDDFKAKLIAVDSTTGPTVAGAGSEKGGLLLIGSEPDDLGAHGEAQEGKSTSSSMGTGLHVTPVHTLRLSLSTTSPPSSTCAPKLVDIWSEPHPDPTPASTPAPFTPAPSASSTILSYSAAAKRGKKASAKHSKPRSAGAPPPKHPASLGDTENVEQNTYQSLTQIAATKPLVHVWDLDEEASDPTA